MFSGVKPHGREHGICRSKRGFIVSNVPREFWVQEGFASSPLRPVDVGTGTEKHFGGFHNRLRKCRMRVDG